MIKILVLFSDPPGQYDRLRLDREDRIIGKLAKRFSESAIVERHHASELEDIHFLLNDSVFDVIHFSGHGSPDGIMLDKSDIEESGELVSDKRLQSLLAIPEIGPKLVLLLSCYSNDSLSVISQVAPFVISAVGRVNDSCCLEFVGGFYERLFAGFSIQNSFQHAETLIKSKGLSCDNFRLDRRVLLESNGSKFVESAPDAQRDSILVNLDNVIQTIAKLEMPEEEVLHLISRKLRIHRWIFDVPRENCIIPIGRMLFGEFSWVDSNHVVYCNKIRLLDAGVSQDHLRIWHKLLIGYNDLASSDYRSLQNPAGEENKNKLLRAINLLDHYIRKFIRPAEGQISQLGFQNCLAFIEFIDTHCEMARDHFEMGRLPQVVKSLEEALTNFHELVDGLRPAEQAREE